MLFEQLEHGGKGNLEHRCGFERPGHSGPRPVVKHAYLAEQIGWFHERDDTLTTVDRVGNGDGEPPA